MNASLCRFLLAVPFVCAVVQAQSAPTAQSAPPPIPQGAVTVDASPQTQKPSDLIAPAVDHLSQVVSQIQLEKWKGSSRDETDGNLRSVERNLKSTLPDLVTAADAQPASVAASLPLLRNLDALCAVMIRVAVTAHSSAPTPQSESITGALTALQSARNTLADQVLANATAQEKQLASLNSQVATLNARMSTPAAPPPAAAPAMIRPRPRKKPAAKAAPNASPKAPQQ